MNLKNGISQLNSEDETDRIYAAEDLGEANEPAGVVALFARLDIETSRAVKEAIFLALAGSKDADVVPLAADLLASEEAFLRNGAIQLLQGKGVSAIPVLLKKLKDEELAPVFMKEIRELHNTGLRATGQKEPKHTVIKCPTDLPTGLCKAVLKVDESDMDAKIQCRKCKSIWTVSWLIRVMLSLPDSQYWLDVESIAKYRSGLNARKVRYWAKKWHTPKWAGLYDLGKFIEKFDKEFPHHSTESEQS